MAPATTKSSWSSSPTSTSFTVLLASNGVDGNNDDDGNDDDQSDHTASFGDDDR